MPTQAELIKRLTAENAELNDKLDHVTERVAKLEAALQAALDSCDAKHNESCIRVESVEENLCQLTEGQRELQYDQASLMLKLESQQMYSRKQTLLLTGPAVGLPTRGEDTRGIVLGLLSRHLGLSGLQPSDICACHRLKNPKVILVRFSHLDHSERVYRARTKPKQRGLLIFESLTAERLSVIDMIKALKTEGNSRILSYYTQGGKILVRTSEDRTVRPVEIPFGLNKNEIKALCDGERVSPTPVAVCDQFRAVNSGSSPLRRDPGSRMNPWTLVSRRGQQTKPSGRAGGPRIGHPPVVPQQGVSGEVSQPQITVPQSTAVPAQPAVTAGDSMPSHLAHAGQGGSPGTPGDPPPEAPDVTADTMVKHVG